MASFKKTPASRRDSAPTPSTIKRRGTDTVQQSLSLELPAEPCKHPLQATAVQRLWFCIYLPQLPLEALDHDSALLARAVFEDSKGIRKVLLSNRAAQADGIGPGMSVNAALALRPELQPEERDPAKEERALQGLAGWAEKFTSFVSIESPDLLLLEIAGSLRLFGGLRDLRRQIVSGLEKQGFDASLAIAPTPLAATWLARAGRRVCIVDGRKLTGTLSRLPLACLGWPEAVYEALKGMGISSIGECLRLPREGFARRFGACRLLELDRALGRLPDPRASYRTPQQFCAEYELCEEQNDRELILHACHELLQKLERFLLTRQLSVQRIQFSFFHLKETASFLTVGCIEANHRVVRWFELLGIQFDRLTLTAPVIAIRLCGGHSQAFSVDTDTLRFTGAAENQQSLPITHLIERLSARIGNELVHGVMTVAEHRPQYAWQAQGPLAQGSQCPTMANSWYEERLRRPLWMLPEPRPLQVAQDRPRYQGQLQLLDGPERLETGWWDDDGIARDYFVAINPQGICLWIFRNRSKDSVWYLHGIFG